MRLRVSHITRYRYDQPVFLEPHTFRLLPRSGGGQRVLELELKITPRPAGSTESLDASNNTVRYAWFEDKTASLVVESAFAVETLRSNPFDFVLPDLAAATLPARYPEEVRATLTPYCGADGADASAYQFAKAVAVEVGWQTIPFLAALNRKLHDSIEHVEREKGEPQSVAVTLETRRGACRDLATAYAATCRSMGLAARFVSGYELGAALEDRAHMHAWAEVFVPGGGWRGFDPSRGLAVAESHIAVATGVTPRQAAPVTGSFRGSGVKAAMDFEIQVDEWMAT